MSLVITSPIWIYCVKCEVKWTYDFRGSCLVVFNLNIGINFLLRNYYERDCINNIMKLIVFYLIDYGKNNKHLIIYQMLTIEIIKEIRAKCEIS